MVECIIAMSAAALTAGLQEIVPEGSTVERVATGFQFTEGPAWDGEGLLYFSDIPANTIYKMDEAGHVAVFLRPSEKTNGMAFDGEGRLVACRHDGRDVVRISREREVTMVADRFEGGMFNSPNDCVLARDGAIYFTDPSYGLGDRPREQDCEAVYRVSVEGRVERVISDMERPNGLGISPDGETLYVADSQRKTIRAYRLAPDGGVVGGRDFASLETEKEGVPDGMALDVEGNIYCTGGGGVWVFTPTGEHLGTIETPEVPANCTFGGADLKVLYITARTSVYRIRLGIAGAR
jgi:gluconolactonase